MTFGPSQPPTPSSILKSMYLEVIAVLHYNKHDDVIHAYVSKACVSSKKMYLRHQTYTLYYRDVCILVFLHVFAYFTLLRCMLKFKRLACGSDDVTQYNTIQCIISLEFKKTPPFTLNTEVIVFRFQVSLLMLSSGL